MQRSMQLSTTGRTAQELQSNMVESLNLLFEDERVVSIGDLSFQMELTSVFEVYPVINMKALSRRVGMNYTLLAQYATGKKKPSPKQTAIILDAIHDIGRELSELSLISH